MPTEDELYTVLEAQEELATFGLTFTPMTISREFSRLRDAYGENQQIESTIKIFSPDEARRYRSFKTRPGALINQAALDLIRLRLEGRQVNDLSQIHITEKIDSKSHFNALTNIKMEKLQAQILELTQKNRHAQHSIKRQESEITQLKQELELLKQLNTVSTKYIQILESTSNTKK